MSRRSHDVKSFSSASPGPFWLVAMIVCYCSATAAGQELQRKIGDTTYSLQLTFEDDFDNLDHWLVESTGKVSGKNNQLVWDCFTSGKQAGTIWCRKKFSGPTVVEYDAVGAAGARNLNFIFYATHPDGLLKTTKTRTGEYGQYHRFPNYIITYLTPPVKDKPGTFTRNGWRIRFRKNPGFNLLGERFVKTKADPGRKQRITYVFDGSGWMKLFVDGKLLYSFLDKTSPLRSGYHGFRTWNSDVKYANFKVYSIQKPSNNAIGVKGQIGCGKNPKRTKRLQITKPGVYENYLVDSAWAGGNRVKITADNVTLRNCEIRNATGNGVGVFGKNVTIENCKIHHLLHSTFARQHDAHGITGRWNNVTIRNCEIYYVSGDAVQFDPDRRSTGKLLIENCTFWTGPLPADAAGFKKGQRPGENAFDSKTPPKGPRCELTIRNCLMHGWQQPGQIGLMAALNIKENVRATVENCLFRDNEVCFRLRGPTGRGDARVTVNRCAIFEAKVGVRLENKLRDLKIRNLAFGAGVRRKYHFTGGRAYPGYDNQGESKAESFEKLLKNGIPGK